MIKNTFTSVGFLVSALATAAYSCSSTTTGGDTAGLGSPSTNSKGGGKATGGTSGAVGNPTGGSGGGSSGNGTGNTGTGNGPSINVDAGQQDGNMTIEEDAACGTGKASATLKPVNMLVMFDRSWSMNECGDGSMSPITNNELDCPTLSRWDLTSAALIKFFQSPDAADLNVALRFFPDDTPGCTGFPAAGMGFPGIPGMDAGTPAPAADGGTDLNCDIATCAVPLVDIAPLLVDPAPTDAHEGALVAAVMNATPPGPAMPNPNPSTPTYPALGGAEQWAVAYQMSHPDGQAVVVLVTDGEPQGCDTSTNNIARLAADANTQAGILTYVVGLTGSSEAGLNQIARSGGTDQAYFVSDGNTATDDLLKTLISIKGMALSCDLEVPTNDEAGMEINPHLINVNYASGTNPGMELGYVENLAACGSEPAWYYDDPMNPMVIHLCPSTCDTVKADTMATLQILAGCKPHIVTR